MEGDIFFEVCEAAWEGRAGVDRESVGAKANAAAFVKSGADGLTRDNHQKGLSE
jgi:hypothetical protein